jgi:lactaldehyde dehydrogenase/glycolaldehyde dehydrogenase
MDKYQNFTNGKFVPSTGPDIIEVINPSNGTGICSVPDSSDSDVEAAISAAESAQHDWARLPAVQRAKGLHRLADKIRRNLEPLARVITEEQGKILGLARVEVDFTADYIDYMAEWARRIEGEILVARL